LRKAANLAAFFALTARRAKRNLPAGRFVLHDIHKRALRRAAEIVGGNEELRRCLSVSEAEFSSWAGMRDLPREVFLRLVDIITEKQPRGG
jgi:hypothetical protein